MANRYSRLPKKLDLCHENPEKAVAKASTVIPLTGILTGQMARVGDVETLKR
jgi:hypothetical protein